MQVKVNNTLFAGASISFEGFQRKSEQLLGISGGRRFTNYGYDDRGRVTGSVVATVDPNALPQLGIPGASTVTLSDADFRSELNRTVVQNSDPPSTLTGQSARGHKVASITLGSSTEAVSYQGVSGEGSVRTDDAKYHYEFDEKEHLRSITERLIPNGTQSRLIRVRFAFDGFGRIVGRRVEIAPVSNGQPPLDNQWTLAPSEVVASQPLPAATTFVWDPVTDNLAAIFVEGASRNGTTLASGGLLRQFIHGGMGMDDPIEVMTSDARLYPIFDEAGDGSLQAIIGENGQLVARGLTADPYAEQQLTITAPAVDEVKLTAKKDSSGSLTQVQVTMHATEPLDAATIMAGTRLAAVSRTGTTVRVATATAIQPDPYTASWTLTGADWTALTTNATAISIAATSSLRSTTYGSDVSEERCAKCGRIFRAFHQSPHDYGIAAFVSERGRVAIVVADDDPVWQEAATLLNTATDRPRSDYESANCFPHLFNRTVDEIDGERLYMWGDVPCSQCGSFERVASRPIEPPEFVDVDAETVTHRRWTSLSVEEKRRQVDEAMEACRAEIAAMIAASLTASR